jgi:hypothetical protein
MFPNATTIRGAHIPRIHQAGRCRFPHCEKTGGVWLCPVLKKEFPEALTVSEGLGPSPAPLLSGQHGGSQDRPPRVRRDAGVLQATRLIT